MLVIGVSVVVPSLISLTERSAVTMTTANDSNISKDQLLRDGINNLIISAYKQNLNYHQRSMDAMARRTAFIKEQHNNALLLLEQHCLENNGKHVTSEVSPRECTICGARYV